MMYSQYSQCGIPSIVHTHVQTMNCNSAIDGSWWRIDEMATVMARATTKGKNWNSEGTSGGPRTATHGARKRAARKTRRLVSLGLG
jgi:hypothetical protein